MATVNFTSEQIAPGFAGLIDTTTNPLRIYGASRRTVWAGHITGTDAVLTANSNFGANNNLVEVSIDGSPFVSADHVGADYTLFSGLPDQSRFVAIRYGAAFSTAPYVLADSEALLTVTGADPAVLPFSDWAELRDGNPLTAFSAMTAAAPANYSPAYIAATSGALNGSNVACIKLRGAFNQLVAACNTSAIFISKNGTAPVRYDRPEEDSGSIFCPLAEDLGGDLATYYVWNSGSASTQFSVSGDAPLVDCGTKRRLDQYGDSITDGSTAGAGRGEVDTMKVAARLGFVGSTSGVSGHTTAQCNTLLDTVLPGRVISSEDVAILAIGRNDTGGGLPQVEYESCISKLLSAGYGTVLCRGVIPGANEVPWTDFNTDIQGVVSGLSDPRVIYIDTNYWVGLSFSDNTHPDAAGYDVMTEYAVISYSDALDITPTVEPFEFTASGGITVGGTAGLFHAFAATGSGGITAGGSAEYSSPTAVPFEFTGTGGLVLSGSADYSGPIVVESFDFTGSGGLSVGGSAYIDAGGATILPPSGLVVIIDTSDQVIQCADRPLDPYDTEWVVFAWDERIADASIVASAWVLPTDWNLVRTAQNQEISARGRDFQSVNAALVDVNNAVAGRYVVSNRVSLSDGRQYERSFKIKIKEM